MRGIFKAGGSKRRDIISPASRAEAAALAAYSSFFGLGRFRTIRLSVTEKTFGT